MKIQKLSDIKGYEIVTPRRCDEPYCNRLATCTLILDEKGKDKRKFYCLKHGNKCLDRAESNGNPVPALTFRKMTVFEMLQDNDNID